ncbi:MAG: tetratricopeptide repeat protein, partial [Gammaproteobacteria bacterium]|nr:tetratricopeptide repeat protein [Gammaproteobacteria bacterium]
MKKLLVAASLALLAAHIQAADSPKEQAANFYEDAEKRFNAEEFDVAIIQLKNALQQDPYMLPALVLLGNAYVQTGNGAAAETALNKALQLGADPAITVVPLAKAYVQQFKHNQLLSQEVPEGLPLMTHAELLTVKASAAMEVDDAKALDALLTEVERFDPGSLEAINMRATKALLGNDFARTERLVKKLKALAPGDPQTYMLSASLHHRQGESEEALADYDKVIELNPQDRAARIARVSILLALSRWTDAEPDFEALAELAPYDPRVAYLRAVKLGGAGDDYGMNSALNEAANAIEALGETAVSRNSQLLMVGGIVNFRLENYEKAQSYLGSYTAGHPEDINAATMLATVLIRKGEYAPAVKLLEPIVREQQVSPQLLALLAQAYTGAERHNKATAVLERAAAMRPNDASIATKLAVARANRGQMETALADLANVFEQSNYEPLAGLRLATLHLNRGEIEQAQAVARRLYEQNPENLTFTNLLGITEVGLDRLDA